MLAFEQKSQKGMSVFKLEIYLGLENTQKFALHTQTEEWCWQTTENYIAFK